jgi:hypothetical protein
MLATRMSMFPPRPRGIRLSRAPITDTARPQFAPFGRCSSGPLGSSPLRATSVFPHFRTKAAERPPPGSSRRRRKPSFKSCYRRAMPRRHPRTAMAGNAQSRTLRSTLREPESSLSTRYVPHRCSTSGYSACRQ